MRPRFCSETQEPRASARAVALRRLESAADLADSLGSPGAFAARAPSAALLVIVLALVAPAAADMRVQDVAKLQGQRTNKLFGFGLVVGLKGTGDGAKSPSTLRALQALHRVYHQPVLDVKELEANNNVAIVAVEVTIPEFGAREGQTLDVTVSALGTAKSLAGGQLLTTPLQEATLALPDVLALAGGRIDSPDKEHATRGVIRNGATLEQDFFYNFLDGEYVWLVLDDAKAGFQWAQVVARSLNHALADADQIAAEENARGRVVVQQELALAVGPKNVRVRIPPHESARPARFIDRVLQTPLFMPPSLPARVVINRQTRQITFTGSVTIAPTVLQIPGLGTVAIGGSKDAATGVIGIDTEKTAGVEFQELLSTLSKLQLSPEQMVAAVEHLHRTGTLNAQLIYAE